LDLPDVVGEMCRQFWGFGGFDAKRILSGLHTVWGSDPGKTARKLLHAGQTMQGAGEIVAP
jgi:hypothetical protein